ncbi:MAG: DNA polymerase III subunit beta [Candidatus Anammoxibacter sp.]
MKIKCKKELIYKGFQMLSGVITNTTTKPILQNVKIEVRENIIELYATNLEVAIRYFITIEDSNCVENGIVVVPEIKMESILREWDEDSIEINTKKNICYISGKDSNFTINGESDIDQFPVNPEFSEDGFFEVDPYIFIQMIKRTVFVVIGEKIRHTLSGVFINVNDNKMEMVATDSRRLSKVENIIDNNSGLSCNCIVPVKGLLQLERVIANDLKGSDDQKLKVKIENNRILFKSQNFIISVQLIDGKYPDCNKIIPEECTLKVIMNAEKLFSAVKRAGIVTTEGSKLVKFAFSNNKLMITAEVSEVGNSKVTMDIDYDYEAFEIGFNPDFLKDVLNVVTNDTITMEFSEQGKAGVIKEILNNDGNFKHVIMPINLKEE